MSWWYDPDNYADMIEIPKVEVNKDAQLPWQQKVCYHDWKPIVLIISTVYNCSKCGVKKEDYESYKKIK
jgi:hypothetical protein